MKLVINYDFFNAIRDVKEPYGVLKVFRNNKDRYMVRLPLWGIVDFVYFQNIESTIMTLGFQYMLVLGSDLLTDKMLGIDTYATMATKKLKSLVEEFNNINVKTDYELLLQSIMYNINYKLNLNKTSLLKEEKYIYVPTYNYDGSIKDTSILQEHMIGSNDYILSVGEPEKKYHKVLIRT